MKSHKKICKIDISFFKKIDSHDKAQILGFIYADGCIRIKPNQPILKIVIHKKDKKYLEKIRKKLSYKNKLRVDSKGYIVFAASNENLSNDLVKLGALPKKSLILKFPTEEVLPKKYWSSFILGYFEGDGSIYNIKNPSGTLATKIHFVGTKQFLIKIKKIIKKETGAIGGIYKFNHSPAYYYVIGNQGYIKKFIEYVYSNNTFCMDRKWKKALVFNDRIEKEKKYV